MIDAPQTAAVFSSGNLDEKKLAQALLGSSVVNAGRIKQMTMIIRGSDKKGPYTLTMTMSLNTIQGIAKGILSDADAQKQIQVIGMRGKP